MILGTAFAIKVLLPVAVMMCGYFLLCKRISRQVLAVMAVGVAAIAVAANTVAEKLPPLKDPVVLTALGEKNENARREEVFIEGFTVDGEDVAVENPVEGNWYWIGDLYCWRADYDTRRPAELTDSITLEVPVGWSRTIDFQANEWRGFVNIETADSSRVVDCYKPTRQTMSVSLGRSSSKDLILNQIQYLAVYASVLIFLSIVAIVLTERVICKPDRLAKVLENHWDTAILILLSCWTFYILWEGYPTTEFFEGDATMCLGMAIHPDTLGGALEYAVTAIDVEPPLWLALSWLYYRIAPISDKWLFLLPNIYVAAAVFIAGKIVSKYTNKTTGVVAAFLMLASSSILDYGEYIRNYSLIIPIILFLVYSYTNVCLYGRTTKNTVLFALAMTLTAYCNYHALAILVGLFIFDIIWNRKNLKIKFLLPYVYAGLCYLPWIIVVAKGLWIRIHDTTAASRFFSLNKDFLQNLYFRLGGENVLVGILLTVAIAFLIWAIFRGKAKEKECFYAVLSLYLMTFFCVVFVVRGLTTPGNSFLLYRYFAPVYPLAVLVECCLLQNVEKWIKQKTRGAGEGRLIPVIISAVLAMGTLYNWCGRETSSWITSADILAADSELYFQNSCVIIFREGYGLEKSWVLDYLIKSNDRPFVDIQVVSESEVESINSYDKLYVFTSSPSERQLLLDQGYVVVSQPDGYLFVFGKNTA